MSDHSKHFIEARSFTQRVIKYLTHGEYLRLQNRLMANPEEGAIIPRTGGFRKIRVARTGGGKSGGFRVVYYYLSEAGRIYLVDIYAKSGQDNISEKAKAALRTYAAYLKQHG